MYKMIDYSDNYSKISAILWEYCRDEPAVNANGAITNFTEDNITDSFKVKEKITGQTDNNGTIKKSKYFLENSWNALINCEINLDINWSENCIIVATSAAAQIRTFSITDTKLYVPVVTLSTQENAKLLKQLKSGFKRIINWNKYFQGVSRLFVLPFEKEAQRTSFKRCYLPTREIKSYNVMIDGQNFFNQPIRNNLITYDNIWKIATVPGDDYTTGCLLEYKFSKTIVRW